jgi:hypothetical protein
MCISNRCGVRTTAWWWCYRDADDDTLPVAVIGADADDTLAAQPAQPSYYSLLATTA